MPPDPSDERVENSEHPIVDEAAHESGDIFGGESDAPRRTRHRKTGKKRSAGRSQKNAAASSDASVGDDIDDRFGEHAAQILAATRERIVERPLQAVLVAAAAGAFAALLLGAGRR